MSQKNQPPPIGMPLPGQYPPMPQQYYPNAPPSYDQAMSHPVADTAAHHAHQQAAGGWMHPQQQQQQPGMYPSYQAAASAAASAQNYQQMQAFGGYPGGFAQPGYYPQVPQAPYPTQSQPSKVPPMVVSGVGAFDGGARFNGISQPVIPPAPPGVAPNAAQVASMTGQNVVVGQKKGSFFMGSSSGGGMTFW